MSETSPNVVIKKPKLTRNSLTVQQKKQIISEYEHGLRIVDLASKYNMATSTITTIIKSKEQIKAASVAVGIKKLYEKGCRNNLHDKMEKQLLVWIHDQQINGEPLTQHKIREQAKKIFDVLAIQFPDKNREVFKGSNGWFHQFKKRSGIWCKGEGLKAVQLKQEDVEFEKPVVLHIVGEAEEVVYNMEPSDLAVNAECEDGISPKDEVDEPEGDDEIMEEAENKADVDFEYTDIKIPTEDILRMMHYWEEFHILAKKWHPNKKLIEELNDLGEDRCLKHFKELLRKREFVDALGKVLSVS